MYPHLYISMHIYTYICTYVYMFIHIYHVTRKPWPMMLMLMFHTPFVCGTSHHSYVEHHLGPFVCGTSLEYLTHVSNIFEHSNSHHAADCTQPTHSHPNWNPWLIHTKTETHDSFTYRTWLEHLTRGSNRFNSQTATRRLILHDPFIQSKTHYSFMYGTWLGYLTRVSNMFWHSKSYGVALVSKID